MDTHKEVICVVCRRLFLLVQSVSRIKVKQKANTERKYETICETVQDVPRKYTKTKFKSPNSKVVDIVEAETKCIWQIFTRNEYIEFWYFDDLMSQEIEYQRGTSKKRFDVERSGKMFLVGSIQGPINHFFYGWLDRAIKTVNLMNVSKKILLDQLIMSPVCIVAFFYSAGLVDGQSTNECTDELKSKFLTVYMADWTVWPITQFVNFYYVHPKYRVIYVNFITMLYNVFLSYIKHDESYTVTTK